jgi:hypothetical protein
MMAYSFDVYDGHDKAGPALMCNILLLVINCYTVVSRANSMRGCILLTCLQLSRHVVHLRHVPAGCELLTLRADSAEVSSA